MGQAVVGTRRVRTATLALTTAAMTLAAASPALASTQHHATHFSVKGIVTSVHGSDVHVLARTAHVGKHSAHNRIVTLRLAARHKGGSPRAALLAAGDAITASGAEQDGEFQATSVTAAPRPAEVLMGTVASVSGNLVTLVSRDRADGGHTDHQGDGRDKPVVDVTNATFSGVAGSAAQLAAGQTVLVLGEESDDTMLAAKVYSFAAAPAVALGRVAASDPTSKSLTVDVAGRGGDHEGDDGDQQDAQSPAPESSTSPDATQSSDPTSPDATSSPDATASPDAASSPEPSDTPDASGSGSGDSSAAVQVTVDASGADVVLNGNEQQQAVTFPQVGDRVLVVGTAGSSADSITAAVVFAFNGDDRHGVGHNHD